VLYTDLTKLKTALGLPASDTTEDVRLQHVVALVSSWVEEILGRDLSAKSRTQFYKGTNTPKLPLRNRPVLTTFAGAACLPRVWVDESAVAGANSADFGDGTELTYGSDFYLDFDADADDDGEDDASRSGLLIRRNNYWPRPGVRARGFLTTALGEGRGTIKVTYTENTLPPALRGGVEMLCSRVRAILPVGAEINSESYEDRSIGVSASQKEYLLALAKPLLLPWKNWSF
jgi:hypothetical protein